MEVLHCSGVQYGGETDCPQQTSSRDLSFDEESKLDKCGQAQSTSDRADVTLQGAERPQTERQADALQTSGGHCNGASHRSPLEGQDMCCDSLSYNDYDINVENNGHLILDTAENDSPNSNREGEPPCVEPAWLEGDKSLALWVKWRGRWQAGIRCARADWPLTTLKAKPTHDRKKYFVIFFPHTRIHSWANMQLVRPIDEYPHPVAYKTHEVGHKLVKDLTIARRFIMQKLSVGMLNVVDQFHTEALIETARDVAVWKEFAMEASRCNGYPDLGKMLLKLQNMISNRYMNSEWLQSSLNSWLQRCQNANSAESIEMLKEELFDSVNWNEVHSPRDAQVQFTLGSEWKTWKHEVMKLFSVSNPVTGGGDLQQQSSDGSLSTSPQLSRKRPKLEVRRAESHAFQVESRESDQSGALEIDSEFFNNRGIANAVPTDSPSIVADKWNGIVVEAENGMAGQAESVAMTPVNQVASTKALDYGNKNRQCVAFIESKGRQCVRWANDGDVYCCVHLSSRFTSGSAKAEGSPFNDTPMCEGTTVLGTKCKHRSLPGLTYCKKHRPKTEMPFSNASENPLKRKYEEDIPSLESTQGKEIVLVGDVGSALEVDPISVMQNEACRGRSNLAEQPEPLAIDCYNTEVLRCIGSCLRENSVPCLESPKRHGLYCEKHLPSWLKRARNGKSRIVSKEIFIDLLKDCRAQEQKVRLHQACELFYRLFKSILSLRNPVPKEVQFQWALSEASKDIGVGEFFAKLVCSEKERLRRIWGFSADEDVQISSSVREEPALLTWIVDGSQEDDKSIKCKVCSEAFLDGESLGNHWRDSHKKEAQWLFRGYACAICLDSFTNKKVLETHVQERHHVQFVEQCMLLQCIPCGSHFGNAEELWLHVLSAHPDDFRLSKEAQPTLSTADETPPKLELCSSAHVENSNENSSGTRRFICKFCGLKFDLLPDLGRHHQAAHMGPSLASSRPAKRGVRYYAYRMKSGRLSRPKFKKSSVAASYRIRSRATDNIRKRIQATKALNAVGITVQPRVAEAPILGSLEESQCTSVATILFSEIQKTKPRPNNADILSVARSTCCRIGLKASLEAKYGLLPERLYLKAAKLCSEHGIFLNWHQDGFVCPRGCRAFKDSLLSPLKTLSNGIVGHRLTCSSEPVDEKWQVDESHYVLDSGDLVPKSSQNFHLLCEDISFGKESIQVACVADYGLSDSDSILVGGSDRQSFSHIPWKSFTYITNPMLDESLTLDTQSFQLGCACPRSTCCPETCDHVYLFDSDYDDARDIYGKPMRGRFPYDDRSRIILEEGYLVYECNQMCSCPRTCPNRVLQNGVRVKLEVFKTEEKGWAVRASEAILRGTFICEYIGEVLDEQEANLRRKRYGKEGCGYLFEMDSHVNDMSRLIEGQGRYVIDATKYGNVSRFINHSCSPNLAGHQVLVESMDCQRSHIGFYANRDISLGEELTYDYRYSFLPGEGFSCQCGTPVCRGRIH